MAKAPLHKDQDEQHTAHHGSKAHVSTAIAVTDFPIGKRVERHGSRQHPHVSTNVQRFIGNGHQKAVPTAVYRIERDHPPEHGAFLHPGEIPPERFLQRRRRYIAIEIRQYLPREHPPAHRMRPAEPHPTLPPE